MVLDPEMDKPSNLRGTPLIEYNALRYITPGVIVLKVKAA